MSVVSLESCSQASELEDLGGKVVKSSAYSREHARGTVNEMSDAYRIPVQELMMATE